MSISNNILDVANEFINENKIKNTKIFYDSTKCIVCITGDRDGALYKTVISCQDNNTDCLNPSLTKILDKQDLIFKIKELYNQGYTQQQIADMLGISQTTVHNYLYE